MKAGYAQGAGAFPEGLDAWRRWILRKGDV